MGGRGAVERVVITRQGYDRRVRDSWVITGGEDGGVPHGLGIVQADLGQAGEGAGKALRKDLQGRGRGGRSGGIRTSRHVGAPAFALNDPNPQADISKANTDQVRYTQKWTGC